MAAVEGNRLAAFGMVVLIWTVQLIIYPAFASIARDRFRAWHARYTRSVTYIVLPLMLAQASLLGCVVASRPGVGNVAAAAMVAIAWLTTFLVSVPAHEALQQRGPDDVVIRRLVGTNWIRTVAWTLAFVLSLAA
jgi:hypothetical protein